MRLFVGVELGRVLIGRAVEIVDELRRRVARLAPRARLTWPTAERLHVTLVFIGRVEAARVDAVREAVRMPFGGPPFAMGVSGLGAFPARGAPRVLWAGIGEGREQVLRLAREVSGRLAPLGIGGEARPFHPHVTLARVREPAGLRTGRLLEGIERTDLGATRVEAITLFESRPSSSGSTYVALERAAVGG